MQLNLHMSEKSSKFAADFVRLCKITTNNYKPQTTRSVVPMKREERPPPRKEH